MVLTFQNKKNIKLKTKMKLLFLKTAFVAIFALLAPIKLLIWLIIYLCGVDVATGIWVSFKENGWRSFKSRKLRRTAIKLMAYLTGVLSAFLIEVWLFQSSGILISSTIASFFILTEFSSIMENLFKITNMKIFLTAYDWFKNYLNTNKGLIDKVVPKIDDEEITS